MGVNIDQANDDRDGDGQSDGEDGDADGNGRPDLLEDSFRRDRQSLDLSNVERAPQIDLSDLHPERALRYGNDRVPARELVAPAFRGAGARPLSGAHGRWRLFHLCV